ncbi:MAG: hypothetical protein IJU51_01275 [Clostridia bacterium]|nr:hypothetical protein [Clostridia bacterium]
MSSKQSGLAYDLSLFEPEPAWRHEHKNDKAVKENIVKLNTDRLETPKKKELNFPKMIAVGLIVSIAATVGIVVLRNNVVINELNEQIHEANTVLENQENLEAQYQLRIDRKLTDEFVQQYAETKLGMTKANANQKEFVSLTDGDKGEVVRGDGKESFLSRFAKAFHI